MSEEEEEEENVQRGKKGGEETGTRSTGQDRKPHSAAHQGHPETEEKYKVVQ